MQYEPLHNTIGNINEGQWLRYVCDLAQENGWSTYHTHTARYSNAGFPDLVMMRPPEIVVAELKSKRGVVTESQMHWLMLFDACGIESYVWRPTEYEEVRSRLLQPRRARA